MSEERRYTDDEIAQILERAATSDESSSHEPTRSGLTLAELQDAAAQAGIAPARIAEAARAIASRDAMPPAATFLGAPIAVARSVYTERAMTDAEWTRLVVELRETFAAHGRVTTQGPLRTWSNGNLQVHEEPCDGGYRIRMQTRKEDAVILPIIGGIATFLGAIMLVKVIPRENLAGIIIGGTFIAAGILTAVRARLMLPGWAATRAAQMERLAAYIPRLLSSAPQEGS